MNEIVAFNKTKADLAEYKEANAKMVFDYEDEQGNKDARSHVYKLRKARTAFDKLRKATKAEALAACKNIDSQAKEISTEFDEMIAVHQDPIKRIEEAEEAEKQAALDKIREDREKEEADRLADLEAKELELEELKAKAKATEEAALAKEAAAKAEIERIAREKKIAEDAKIEAEQEAGRKLKLAEEKRLADLAALSKLAEDEKVAVMQKAMFAKKAEADEKARLAKIETERVADESHREQIEEQVFDDLNALVRDVEIADGIRQAIKTGIIRNVTINY